MKKALLITLIDDVIISASSSTTGGHRTLDYIPGSLLLGVAAANLYKKIQEPSESWALFHSGHVSFQNGFILSAGGHPTFPSPLSLHYYKGAEPDKDNTLSASTIIRPGIDEINKSRQPKQLRGTYITASGEQVTVNKAATMKTAINSRTGRAAESQLFGYEALCAGQRFLAFVECTDKVPADLFNTLINSLEGPARIGRSRSAQFGRIEIQVLKETDFIPESNINVGATQLTLWCLSDLALCDTKTLQPTLQPQPEYFGLSGGQFDTSNSYIRSRAYSPFNSYRKAFDQLREVITQGSVIHFTNLDPLTKEQLEHLQHPQGCFTESGLGMVVANADICTTTPLKFSTGKTVNIPQQQVDTKNESALIQWLRAQPGDQVSSTNQIWLDDLLESIRKQYVAARQLNAVDPKQPIGPSASQWGAVYQTARDLRNQPDKLYETLFIGEKIAICRERAGSVYSWGLQVSPDHTFVQWLFSQLIPNRELSKTHTLISIKDKDQLVLDGSFSAGIALLAAEMRKPRGEKISLAQEGK
ncbi:hypothetical protein [Neptunomonas sp.]|uniref:hypothetical protein n=1 Tax=Neptunomonas sp. TaxID=1971898 RepID=UPI003564CD63